MKYTLEEICVLTWGEAKAKDISRPMWLLAVKGRKHLLAAKSIAAAVKSVVKTTILRKDRTTDEEYKARLLTCDKCEYAVKKNDKLYTCGPMLKSLTDSNQKTCGCILTKKARDKEQDCPFSYWPTIKKT